MATQDQPITLSLSCVPITRRWALLKAMDPEGVTFAGPGQDYAECMPRLHSDEVMEPGDIVGVINGRITRVTQGADQVMVISKGPLILGGKAQDVTDEIHDPIAFLGQVALKVRGPVNVGNYIVPSGLNDGIGLAIAPEHIQPDQIAAIVGRARASSQNHGINIVNALVGAHFDGCARAIAATLNTMKEELAELRLRYENTSVTP